MATVSDIATAESEVLAARIRELEAENARLREVPPAAPPGSRARGGWWRGLLSAIAIILASILVPVSIAGAWARVVLVDEEAFVSTLAPLVDDPAVQDLIIDQAMGAVNEKVDFAELTGNVFDGIDSLGLPPKASTALDLLRQPAADGLQNLVEQTLTKVVTSDAFSDVFATAVRGAHKALTTAATSDGGGVVVKTDEGVGIALGPIVEQVRQRLVDQGVGVAYLIPAVDRTIIIGSGDGLTLIRTAYALAVTVGWWLPVITLILFALGIFAARRRSFAVVGAGIGAAVGAGALAAGLAFGGTAVTLAADQLDLSPSALDVIYTQLVDSMSHTAIIVTILAIFVAIAGWFAGTSRAARRTRGFVDSTNSSVRAAVAERGLDTGAFGLWLGRNRLLVRGIVVALAVVWLLLMRPLSFGDIVLVIVVALIVGWLLEIAQRRPEESEPIDEAVVVDEVIVIDGATGDEEEVDAETVSVAASTPSEKPASS